MSLFKVVWRYKYVVGTITMLFAVIAVVLALTAKELYTAEVVVTPVRDDALGGASSLASQFGGLASLVGVNLQFGDAEREGAAVLQSRRLVEDFIKRYVALDTLFAPGEEPKTLWRGVKRFRERFLNIRESSRDGTTTIEITWTDPETAALWANQFIALANELMRARALEESNRNLAYINEQLKRTDVVELREVLNDIIETETKRQMLASGRIEYAFTVVDPAVAPEIRSSPKRTLMVLVGGTVGFVIGVVVALIINSVARYKETAPGRSRN